MGVYFAGDPEDYVEEGSGDGYREGGSYTRDSE
jgi:hypothetical protein